jgi:ATP-dependent DNA ligase
VSKLGELMLARAVTELPTGPTWLYQPKLDGWRCCLSRTDVVRLRSLRGKPLARYFPEITAAATAVPAGVVLDGELIVPSGEGCDFAALQPRITTSPRRFGELPPAGFMAFDLIMRNGVDLRREPYARRRAELEELLRGMPSVFGVMPQTTDRAVAEAAWLSDRNPTGVEGVVARRGGQIYLGGRRGFLKCKLRDTAEAVVGGVFGSPRRPEALILGVPSASGRLRVAGHSSRLSKRARAEIGALLTTPAQGTHPWPDTLPASRFGQLPGSERVAYTKVTPSLVIEFEHDQASEQDRYRHPVSFIRVRAELLPTDLSPWSHRAR